MTAKEKSAAPGEVGPKKKLLQELTDWIDHAHGVMTTTEVMGELESVKFALALAVLGVDPK